MILDKEVEGIKYLADRLKPIHTIMVYHDFVDRYSEKHKSKLQTTSTKNYLRERAEIFYRYTQIIYSNEMIIKNELNKW